MSDSVKLLVEFKTVGLETAKREANDAKQYFSKAAKDSAAVFAQAFKERDALANEWMQRLKERDAAEAVMRRQAGISARSELAKTRAEERRLAAESKAEFAQNVRNQIAQSKALANAEIAEANRAAAVIKARQKDIADGARKAAQASASGGAGGGGSGFRVALGAVAGQGLSIGGLASVNPMAAGAVAAAYAVTAVSKDLLANATVWEKFKVGLTDIEGSAVKAKTATDALYELAKRPGISLKEADQVYLQFRALNMEGPKALKVIAAISNAVALSGGGSEEFGRVNLQITQMLSKGKVLEEDLRVMRNSMPRLTAAMREAFGTTTADGIRKLGINAEQFLDKVVGQFEKLPKATQTLESAQENAATAMSKLKAELVPDATVKAGIENWTALLEKLAAAAKGVKHPVDTVNSAWDELKATLADAAGTTVADSRTAKRGEAKYGASSTYEMNGKEVTTEGLSAYSILHNSGSAMEQSNSLKEYMDGVEKAKQAEADRLAAIAKGLRGINRENNELAAQLKGQDKYETRINSLKSEYKDLVHDALEDGKKEEAAALKTQGILKVQNVEKEQADAKKLEVAKKAAELAKERAEFESKADEAFYSHTGNSWAAYQLANPGGNEKDGPGRRSLTNSMMASDKQKIEEGKTLSAKYSPELDRLKAEYDKQRELILKATFETGEERNRVMRELDEQYLRDRAATMTKEASLVATSGESLFNDLASATKMGIDYRYNLEKANIDKTYSLKGLEGQARVDQQRKRDDALQALDEKRQKDMAGTYMTMFMIAKGFALAESVLKLNLAIVNAAASGPFPANLAAMATVAAATGSVVSNIAAINYAGAYDKGGDIPAGKWGVAGEIGPEIVQGPAHITSRRDTAALLGGGRAPVVNVHNYGGQPVRVQEGAEAGSLDIIIGEVSKSVEARLSTGVRSGRGEFANTIKETFNLTRSGGY